MIRTKHGLKALGLCLLAALSLMAVTAVGAQASGTWRVAGAATTGTVGVTGEIDKAGVIKDVSLLSSVGVTNTPIKILCKKLVVSEGSLFVGGGSLGKLEFSECETFLNAAENLSTPCKPDEPIVAKVKNLLIKHENKTYILFSPDNETLTFTTIRLGALPKSECAFGPELPVTGHLVAQCVQPGGAIGCEAEEVVHLIEEAPLKLFKDELAFGTHGAMLDGAALLKLTGIDAGKLWSGLGTTVGQLWTP